MVLRFLRRFGLFATPRRALACAALVLAGSPIPIAAHAQAASALPKLPLDAFVEPRELVMLGNRLLTNAFHPTIGQSLWAVDPETGASERLLETPGFRGAFPSSLTLFGGAVYFAADDGVIGLELWRTDGTKAGTRLVKDLNPGSEPSTPGGFQVFGDTLYFVARAGPEGFRLWKTAGDAGSTVMAPGAERLANPRQLTVAGGRLFFSASDNDTGHELYVIDAPGTAPRLVKDIRPGREDSTPGELTAVGQAVFFYASNGQHGIELWRSDGSAAGTAMVKDIRPGPISSRPAYLTASGNTLFFAADDGEHGVELWASDGTQAGTRLVKDIRPGRGGSGTSFVTEVSGIAYFSAVDGVHGLELWRSDGSDSGTFMLKDVLSGDASSLPNGLARVRDRLLFAAADTKGFQRAWISDGTAAGTRPLRTDSEGGVDPGFPSRFMAIGARMAIVARDGWGNDRLWLREPTGLIKLVGEPLSGRAH